jgi:hypothetical protein
LIIYKKNNFCEKEQKRNIVKTLRHNFSLLQSLGNLMGCLNCLAQEVVQPCHPQISIPETAKAVSGEICGAGTTNMISFNYYSEFDVNCAHN